MKVFLLKALAALLPLIGMAYFNFSIDSANLFRGTRWYRSIASELEQGHAIVGLVNYDERSMHREWIEQSHEVPDVLIIGSSRIMTLGQEQFPGRTVRNHSVSGAVMEDLLGVTGLYWKKAEFPRLVVIQVDPWIFNRNDSDQRWQSMAQPAKEMIERLDPHFRSAELPTEPTWTLHRQKIRELFRPAYAMENFRQLQSSSASYRVIQQNPWPGEWGDAPVRLPDGSMRYPADFKVPAEKWSPLLRFRLDQFDRIDEDLVNVFDRLVDAITSQRGSGTSSEVVIFFPPYRPDVFLDVSHHVPEAIKVESVLCQRLQGNSKVSILGGYDPSKSELCDADFYDPIHLRQAKLWQCFSRAPLTATKATLSR